MTLWVAGGNDRARRFYERTGYVATGIEEPSPRGTPPAIVAKLNKTLNEIIADNAVRQRLVTAGVVVQGSTPEAFGAFMAKEFNRWNTVREAAGIAQQQ